MKLIIVFILFTCCLFSQVTVEQVQQELSKAQREFQEAKDMFNPWYSGPLLTGSGNTFPPGYLGVQPYLFVIDTYGTFSSSGSSTSIPDLWTINPILSLVTGLSDRIEIASDIPWFYNTQQSIHDHGLGDVDLGLGFGLLKETRHTPALKLSVTELFPSGKYHKLSPSKAGLDATGLGSYITTIGLSMSKVVLWTEKHPMAFRSSINIGLPSSVKVKGLNAYGGGIGTNGTVRPGTLLGANFAFEYSFTQNWVFANDFVYAYSEKTTFEGTPGTTDTGATAIVGGPFSDNLSLAPAIEYNPKPTLNFLAGAWFSVWGRNSGNFVGGIISAYFQF